MPGTLNQALIPLRILTDLPFVLGTCARNAPAAAHPRYAPFLAASRTFQQDFAALARTRMQRDPGRAQGRPPSPAQQAIEDAENSGLRRHCAHRFAAILDAMALGNPPGPEPAPPSDAASVPPVDLAPLLVRLIAVLPELGDALRAELIGYRAYEALVPPAPPRPCATPDPDSRRHRITLPAGFSRCPPAAAERLAHAGIGPWAITPAATSFYSQSDGGGMEPLSADFLPLVEALRLGAQVAGNPVAAFLTLLPLTENRDSNPYCLVLGPVLHGAVLRLDHDDAPALTHASLQSFIDAYAALAGSGNGRFGDLADERIADALWQSLDGTPWYAAATQQEPDRLRIFGRE